MPQVRIIAKNFMDMVAALPALKLDKLYDNPFICRAILRSLPPLSKKYVLQLLYIDVPIPAKSLKEWVLPDGFSKHKAAIDRLLQLRVFLETIDRKKETSYRLSPKFQDNIRKHLIHGVSLPRESMPLSVTVKLPSLQNLEAYALEKWECFLLQLISSATAERPSDLNSSMMKIFQRGLLTSRENGALGLTESGFQFLLMDTGSQLWYIIREYISTSEDRGLDSTDLISFLLELSFHVTGQAYNLNTLTEMQQIVIKDLADLGLVKLQQGRKESWFIPTELATNLSVSLSDSTSRKQGFVVVETNFRLYAYSSSKLQCEILRLFSRPVFLMQIRCVGDFNSILSDVSQKINSMMHMEEIDNLDHAFIFLRIEYELPNLIVAAITKESLYNAFENGIASEQIISFLQQNAHPRVMEKTPSVPENVTDQIRLWETDRNRVDMTAAHLYEDFPSKEVFEAACDHAREIGGMLWEDSKKMRLIVRGESHQDMRDFLRRQR